ncbi:MAG: sialidase family protein [Bacteroidota bacterium]|nr:sialidase family protein [Bacteroidota bacterium]
MVFLERFLLLTFAVTWLITTAQAQEDCHILWYPPIVLSDTNYDAYSPKIALSGDDTVHVTWWSGPYTLRLPYIQSINGGRSFSERRELLVNSISYPFNAQWPTIIANRDYVFIFFRGASGGDTPMRMVVSSNRGTNWSNVRNISPDIAGEIRTASVINDTIAIIYSSGHKKILFSTDGGETWTRRDEDLNYFARVALSQNALHLVQIIGINAAGEIEYRLSHDLGNTWDQTKILSEIDGSWSGVPCIGSDGDSTVQVIWREEKYGCLGIMGCHIASRTGISDNDSMNWMTEEIVTEQPRGYPGDVAVSGGMRLVGWWDELVPGEVFHATTRLSKRIDQGWCSPVDHTPTARTAQLSAVALSKKAINVVWHQYVPGSPEPQTIRVFYRRGEFGCVSAPISYEPGWNMVSLPVRTDSVYRLPSLFKYDGSYVPQNSMVRGIGYWTKLSNGAVDYKGEHLASDTIDVRRGWNMIGSISCKIFANQVQSIPEGIIATNFYGYSNNGYYQSELIEPGRAYWIKVKQDGKLVLMVSGE